MLSKPKVNNDIYNQFADGWWQKDSFLNVLETGIQPVRLNYIKEVLIHSPKTALNCLDIGCGGGILAEDLAKLGHTVTGIDRSAASLETAREHAKSQNLTIDYQQSCAEQLPFDDETFDIVTCCDVLEHVDDVEKVISEISRVLKPQGVFIYDTVNRTVMSYLSVIWVAQDFPLTRFAPKHAHVWHKFIRPPELHKLFATCNLQLKNEVGMEPNVNPLKMLWYIFQVKRNKINFGGFGKKIVFKTSKRKNISYMGHCVKTTS